MTRTDIHCHLLPGLDDGPRDLEESLALAADAVADGTAAVVTTPHVRSDHVVDVADLPDRVRQLEERLRAQSIPLRLHCGGELAHDLAGRLSQAELETIALGPPGARWLLVEAPFAGFDDELYAATDELRDRGFGVVLAHPERSAGVAEGDFAAVRRELRAGALLQLGVWSLAGRHGSGPESAAVGLLLGGLAGVIASDAHGGWRTPQLSVGRRAAIAHGADEDTARRLVDSAPAALVARGIPRAPLQTAA